MNRTRIAISGIVLSMALTVSAFAQEQKVESKDVPAPALAAASKSFLKAQLKGWERDAKDGKTLYEVAMVEGATKRQAVFTADGALVETEEVIDVTSVPTAIRDAVKSKYPKATIHGAEKITRGVQIEYEVGVQNAPKKEIVLSSSGKILSEE